MKTSTLLFTLLFLISCGPSGPSACDCAQMVNERISGTLENLTKSIEEQEKINADWEEKLTPCQEKMDNETIEGSDFEKEVQECLIRIMNEDNAENQ